MNELHGNIGNYCENGAGQSVALFDRTCNHEHIRTNCVGISNEIEMQDNYLVH